MAPLLGYWDMRGIAEPIRCLLHYSGTDFEEKRYKFGTKHDTQEHIQVEWLKFKRNLGLDFPNLPYYIDGDLKLTQSIAILRHLGRKHGLCPGNTEKELCKAENVEQQSHDLMWNLIRLNYNPNFDVDKVSYIQVLPEKLAEFSKLLGTNMWIMGDKLTYVDFHLHESLALQRFLVPKCLDSFENLKDYVRRFEALPKIQQYYKSGKFMAFPICGPSAKFGGTGAPPAI